MKNRRWLSLALTMAMGTGMLAGLPQVVAAEEAGAGEKVEGCLLYTSSHSGCCRKRTFPILWWSLLCRL